MAHPTDVSAPSPAPKPAARRLSRPTEVGSNSLPEAFASVRVPAAEAYWFRRFLAFVGPGYMVSVGYMDPGR